MGSEFLVKNEYCSDEASINSGSKFSQINVLIDKNKFLEMVNGIKNYGASFIVKNDVKQYII